MATQGICSIEGCGKPRLARGWCKAHYYRWYHTGDVRGDDPVRSEPRTRAPCKVDGCSGTDKNIGYCNRHYLRLKSHGDPLGGGAFRASKGEPQRWLREVAVLYRGDDCLTWPYAKARGYGKLKFDGKLILASRAVCMLAHGRPKRSSYHAAHSCGNGNAGCVNPRHIRWATKAENEADKIIHGTLPRGERQGSSRLTEADVRVIRKLRETCTYTEIAKRFGIGTPHARRIVLRMAWGWLD